MALFTLYFADNPLYPRVFFCYNPFGYFVSFTLTVKLLTSIIIAERLREGSLIRLKKRDKKEYYRLIKEKHIVPSILGLIIVYCCILIVAIVVFQGIKGYLVDSKLETEYRTVKYMASLYETATDKEIAKEMLEKEGRDYLVTDSEKNVLYNKGEMTCTFKGGIAQTTGLPDEIQVYYEKGNDTLELDGTTLDIVVGEAYDLVTDKGIFAGFYDSTDKEDMVIPLKFWISVDFQNGSGSFVGKAAYELKTRDMAIIFVSLIVLGVIAAILFIALIGKIIRKVHRQRKLMKAFFTDPVTEGHNWSWFTIKGDEIFHKRKNDKLNYAIINISLVKFNTYCVCHSVEDGERVLQNINNLISRSINRKFEACAHHGTSSFAVLLQYTDDELLRKKVKFILKHIRDVEPSHKFAFHVGIALIPAIKNPYGTYMKRLFVDIEKVYTNACAATATLEGNDDTAIAYFDDKLVEEQKWIDIVNEKQQSALDNEEFMVYYQPKYNPSTDELRGAEALIRWQSPEHGFVSPGKFIPIFEKNGFITEIDHYMLTHVARDQKRWLDMGYKCVPVSVNVSRAHFIESDLAEQIRDTVDREGAPRELIEIELTESAFFDDKKALISTIEKLKGYGFSVSMDDFGAGYSSLNSLKDMPLDVLKLDADFFRGETEGGRGEIVVSEAIKLAKALNMRTVAEGVEVRDQVDFLARQGCDMIQGYYYAKPMPGSDYEQRMAQGVNHVQEAGTVNETEASANVALLTNNNVIEQAPVQESTETVQGEIQGTPEDVREQVTVEVESTPEKESTVIEPEITVNVPEEVNEEIDAAQTQVVAEVSPVAEQIAIENIQEQEIAKLAQAQEQAVAEELGLIQDPVTGEDKAI